MNCEGFIISDAIIWASDDYDINNDTFNWTYFDQNGNILVPTVSSSDPNSAPTYPAPDQGDSIKVVLTVTNEHGCIESTDEIWFYTFVHPNTSFSVDSVCHGLESVFENNTQAGDGVITLWNWTIDGGGQPIGSFSDSTLSYLYNSPGLYTEELTATDANGCSTTYILDSITVWQNPEVTILTSDEDCQGIISEFEAIIISGSNQNINSISWDLDLSIQDSILFGTINDSIVHVLYENCDTFIVNIEVIDEFNCVSIDSIEYEVYCNNDAELVLSDSTICLNNEITTSLDANSNITSNPPGVGVFNVTGGNLTTLTFPNTAITDSINYQIILTVGGNTNCPAIDTNIVTVYPTPLASAIPSAIDSCGPFVVNFNNISTPYNQEDITSMNFEWYVDGVLINTTQNFTHTFNSAAFNDTTYLVELYATSQHDCFDDTSFTITVYPDPIATIVDTGSLIGCEGLTIDENMIYAQEFINNNDTYLWTYTDANGNIITSLDYPSGIENISNIIPPTYSMTQDGDTVIVILTTLNNHGCVQGTDSVQVITIADPVAHFVVDTTQGCHPFTIQTDTTAISSNGIYTWIVSINGNTYDSISTTGYSTPSFTLTNTDNLADSTYTISLTVGDPNDCDSTYIIDNIIVNPVPQASFTTVPTSACADTTIQVNNNSIGNGMTWLWSVNPSLNTIISDSSATEPDFYFPDNQSGSDIIYSISLEVTSDQGCQNTITVDDTIHTRPIALFSINDNTCGPDTISPTNNSSFANGYLWSISSSSNPATIVNTTGFEPNIIIPENNTQDSIVYTLILTAITDNGCQDTDTNIVTVYPTPLASAIPSAIDSCGPFVVNFNNISTPYNQEDITSMNFEWYVDGVLINTTQNFIHTFNSAAFNDTTYLVELYATSQHDCFDDTSFTITVYPDPIATIVDTGSLIGCEGLTIDENMIYAQEFINNNDTYLYLGLIQMLMVISLLVLTTLVV